MCTYSYNRYCFNDDYLPTWFADDEKKHFRPQLPVDKDTVERIKSQFRDIAASPIKKVVCRRLLLLVPPLFACMLPWAVTGCSHVPSAPPPPNHPLASSCHSPLPLVGHTCITGGGGPCPQEAACRQEDGQAEETGSSHCR